MKLRFAHHDEFEQLAAMDERQSYTAADLARLADSRTGFVSVAETARKVPGGFMAIAVGFMAIGYFQPKKLAIKRIAVAPEWRRQGIGSRLIQRAIDTKQRRITCHVNWDNLPGVEFFRAREFTVVAKNNIAGEQVLKMAWHRERGKVKVENRISR